MHLVKLLLSNFGSKKSLDATLRLDKQQKIALLTKLSKVYPILLHR